MRSSATDSRVDGSDVPFLLRLDCIHLAKYADNSAIQIWKTGQELDDESRELREGDSWTSNNGDHFPLCFTLTWNGGPLTVKILTTYRFYHKILGHLQRMIRCRQRFYASNDGIRRDAKRILSVCRAVENVSACLIQSCVVGNLVASP
jgi:hypothetical protein